MAALALLIISSLSVVRASGGEVTWETIRRAIGDTICFSAADKAQPKLAFADPDSCTIKASAPCKRRYCGAFRALSRLVMIKSSTFNADTNPAWSRTGSFA